MEVTISVDLGGAPSILRRMLLRELGLQPGVDREDIRRAFRRLAREHHPDHGGDPSRFRRIVAVYRTLQDLGEGDR